MKIPFFDIKRQSNELQIELAEAIDSISSSGTYIGGKRVDAFEEAFASYIGVNQCISCGNGTDALEMTLEAFGIGVGDEVIIPAYGWVSVYTAVKRSGAIPVFVDVAIKYGNLSSEGLIEAISERTKAVIPIHSYGVPCEILEIKQVCDNHGLILIEDCAQAHGAEVNGQKVGTFGQAAIFSFYPTKNLGAMGDGGAVVTNDSIIASKLREIKDYGRINRSAFNITGRNSRLDELQAAVLIVKLKYLDSFNSMRQSIARRYSSVLSSEKQLDVTDSIFYQYPLLVNNRTEFIQLMNSAEIMCDVHYPYTIPDAFGLDSQDYSVSVMLSKHVVSLPVFPELTEAEISYICEHLVRNKDWII